MVSNHTWSISYLNGSCWCYLEGAYQRLSHALKEGTYQSFAFLCPHNAAKLSSNPTYHMLNDGIQHLVQEYLRVCWEDVTGEMDLQDFSEKETSWDEIKNLAQTIYDQHIAGEHFECLQELPHAKHDMKCENQILFNWDAALYMLLALASNTGAVGLMEDLLWVWVPMFLACGKHKYMTHLLKFLQDLHDTYPEKLSHVIQMHWLCNPNGTLDGFRGMDWLVELNNLYTKVC